MFKSFRIGSIYGIPIKLDVTFLVILPIFAWIIAMQLAELVELINLSMGLDIDEEPFSEGWQPWILGFVAAIGLFGSVLLHELGHSAAAIRYGFPIKSITLWLLGGVAQLSDQPTDWREELLIAIAGPLVSVGLGVGLWLSIFVIPATMEGVLFVVAYLALMNIVLAAFNMLPGFPMDGGRVLRALLARNRPFAQATAEAARVGKWFALLLGLFGLFAMSFLMIAVALFIYIAASSEARYTALQAAVEGIAIKDIMTPAETLDVVTPELPIEDLLELMYRQRHTGYPVVGTDGVVGVITLDDVRHVDPQDRTTTPVSDMMTTDLETVDVSADAIEAIQTMQRRNIGRLIVVDEHNELAGLLTRSDIVRSLDIGAVRSAARRTEDTATIERIPTDETGPRW